MPASSDQPIKFDIAFATMDIERNRAFYGDLLGCQEVRSDWKSMCDKCKKIGVTFSVEPTTVMEGSVGEQMGFSSRIRTAMPSSSRR